MQMTQRLVKTAPRFQQTVLRRAPNHALCSMNSMGSQLFGFQTTMHCVYYFLSKNYWVYTFKSPYQPHVFVCPPSLNSNFGSTMNRDYVSGYIYIDMRALPPLLVDLVGYSVQNVLNSLFHGNLTRRWALAIPYAEARERALGCVLVRNESSFSVESPFLWHFTVSSSFLRSMFAWTRGSIGY